MNNRAKLSGRRKLTFPRILASSSQHHEFESDVYHDKIFKPSRHFNLMETASEFLFVLGNIFSITKLYIFFRGKVVNDWWGGFRFNDSRLGHTGNTLERLKLCIQVVSSRSIYLWGKLERGRRCIRTRVSIFQQRF